MKSMLDFSVIQSQLNTLRAENSLDSNVEAFYFLCLNATLGLEPEEVDDCITDVSYLKKKKKGGGHDRGIDAIYIDDEQQDDIKIHFYNCKYTDKFEKTDNHFPGSEIDKVIGFISSLLQKDKNLKTQVNPVLYEKVEEIWDILSQQSPRFIVHFCANLYNGFEKNEAKRIFSELSKHTGFSIEYHLIKDFVTFLVQRKKKVINAKIKVIDKNHFEKSDGNIRALVANVDAISLLRIVTTDESLRSDPTVTDLTKIKQSSICEDAFDENVRVYLRQRPLVNRNIRATALSNNRGRFFYFNNGVTVTCRHFEYPKTVLGPVVELQDLQVVNGGQTIHALWEAFQNQPIRIKDVEILCRIYETTDKQLSTNIAEYTNSQNPVRDRDIRAIDDVQKKLETELVNRGWFYERKKNQFQDQPRSKRLDSERAGQAITALFLALPQEAKAKKRIIFGEKYDEVFNDRVTAESVLLAFKLLQFVENQRKKTRKDIKEGVLNSEQRVYRLHATTYYLYLFGAIAKKNKLPLTLANEEKIAELYGDADKLLRKAVKTRSNKEREKYNHASYFKGALAKRDLAKLVAKL